MTPSYCRIDKTVNVPGCVWTDTFHTCFKCPFTVLRPSERYMCHVYYTLSITLRECYEMCCFFLSVGASTSVFLGLKNKKINPVSGREWVDSAQIAPYVTDKEQLFCR